jgi:ABC-type lipoprotein release transport system permease subunit
VILRIAFRNTLRQKRRTALTLLTVLGGFTLAALSIGWSDGTYSYIIKKFTQHRLGQIELHQAGYLDRPSIDKRIRNYPSVGRVVQQTEGVEAWAPRVFCAGLASFGDKTAGVQLTGIDPKLEERATAFSRNVLQGMPLSSNSSHQALLGKGLAQILGAQIGDEIVVLTQGADGSIANDVFRLRGIVDTGDETADRLGFYLNLTDAQQLLVLDNDVHEIAVTVYSLKDVGKIARDIRAGLPDPGLDVQPWQEFAKPFYDAMKADQKGMWIMLLVIVLIVAIGVLNTVLMSVLERRREYGLLKALGTRPGQIVKLVVAELAWIALAGVVMGTGLSLALNWILSLHGISLPTPVTFGGAEFDRIYSEINARSFYIPAITVVLSALLVCLAPAVKAARTEPAQAMKLF